MTKFSSKPIDGCDLEIISSNGIQYWVSSAMLARHSSVFESMISISNHDQYHDLSNAVQLSDHDTEDSYTLNTALKILVDVDDEDSKSLSDNLENNMTPSVVRFAQKYEMKSMIAAIKAYLFRSIAQYPPVGGAHTLVAAILGEWVLCGRLIATLSNDMPTNSCAVWEMRRMMDWRRWRQDHLDELTKVGSRFVWAVCRAGTKHAGPKMDQRIKYEAMGEDVAKLMTLHFAQAEALTESWMSSGGVVG